MIGKLSTVIARWYSTPVMICFLVLAFCLVWVFNFSSLPISNSELIKLSGGPGLLDLKFYYSGQEATTTLASYGEAGRAFYRNYLIFDFFFPVMYGFGLAWMLTLIARKAFGANSRWMQVNLLPVGIASADYVENLCILWMLTSFPDNNAWTGTLAGMATVTKHILAIGTLRCMAVGSGALVARRYGFFQRWLKPQNL